MQQPVTPGYCLRKKCLTSTAIKDDHSFDEYISYLKTQGLWVHPSIKTAYFSLQNGLLYPGLKTEETLSGPHMLVKVPKSMLLTTRIANIPPLQKLFQQPFYSNKHFNWEDRIIITFLLYTYSQKQQTVYYQMVKYLSKQIDIISFWPQEDINYLQDQTVNRICKRRRQQFQEQYQGFTQIISKYPGIIPEEYITKDNYRWLFVHLVSRAFGKFLQHITMVPFCQFFNHHNSDVLYDFTYNQENPLKSTQTKYDDPQKYQTQQSRAQVSSSDGSCDSQQYFDQDQFNYSNIEIHRIKWGGKISFNLKDKQTNQIQKKYTQIMKWIEQQIYWDDHSIIIVAQSIEKLNITKNEYMAGRKKYPQSIQALTKLKELLYVYKSKVEEFYKFIKGDQFSYKSLFGPQLAPSVEPNQQRFKQDKFDHFTMRMNKRDHFEANNQVYFCYGRLSNRMMLERYGMAIEGNKYDHVWVTIPIIPFIQGYPDTIQKMQQKSFSIKRKFKLKRRQINLQLIVFFRMSQWNMMRHNINNIFSGVDLDKEIQILNLCLKTVKSQLNKDPTTIQQLQQKLKDKQVSYHQYFGIVYRLEHKRALQLHHRAYSQMKRLIEIIKSKNSLHQQLQQMQKSQQQRQMKWFLSKYLKMISYL